MAVRGRKTLRRVIPRYTWRASPSSALPGSHQHWSSSTCRTTYLRCACTCQAMAESFGFADLPDDFLGQLTGDLEYRLRELTQVRSQDLVAPQAVLRASSSRQLIDCHLRMHHLRVHHARLCASHAYRRATSVHSCCLCVSQTYRRTSVRLCCLCVSHRPHTCIGAHAQAFPLVLLAFHTSVRVFVLVCGPFAGSGEVHPAFEAPAAEYQRCQPGTSAKEP